LRVGLDPQTGGKDELADGGRETREESVEGIVSTDHTVGKLENADQDEEGHEDINQLDTLRSVLHIAIPHGQGNLLSV